MKVSTPVFFVFVSLLFLRCGSSSPKIVLTGNIASDIKALLPEGSMEVQIMDSIVQTPREMELMYRMQKATDKNPEWYNAYLQQYNTMRAPPYHINFGLTEAEYTELVNLKLNLILLPSSTFTIQIANENGMLVFKTGGKIPYLENLKIITVANTLTVDNYLLTFTDTIFVANENHALKSMWKGYSWNFEEPAAGDTLTQQMGSKHYNISIGQLYKNGKTLITINENESYDGERILKIEKPLLLQKN